MTTAAQTESEALPGTPLEILRRRIATPTPMGLAMRRSADLRETNPTPPAPLTTTDLTVIDSAQAQLNALVAAADQAMDARGLDHGAFYTYKRRDQKFEVYVQSDGDGKEWLVVSGSAGLRAPRCSHAGIDFKFFYNAGTKTLNTWAYPIFQEGGHWGLFNDVSAASNRVTMWLLVDVARDAMEQTGIDLELGNDGDDVPDPILRIDDLKLLLNSDLPAIYGPDGRHMQEWLAMYWYELTGLPTCPVRIQLHEEQMHDHKQSQGRARGRETVFSARATSAAALKDARRRSP